MEDVKLTEKQKRFVDYYIETANATEACRRAGYKGNVNRIASENLSKLDFFIKEKLSEKDNQRIASQDEVLQYLTNVLRGEIGEECVVVESLGDGLSSATKIKKEVTPKDRNKAAELLGKRYGLYTDKLDVSGELNININIED